MSLTLKYQGQEVSRTKNLSSYKETYQGTEAEIDTYISSSLPNISTFIQGKGYLTSWRKYNAQGPIFNLEIEYTISYDGSFNNEENTLYGEKSAQLSVRTIQLPLEKAPSYKACWNNYLLGLGDVELPDWATTTSSTILSRADKQNYRWVKSLGEIPDDPVSGKFWDAIQEPTKPGVEYYDFAYFVVTESAKYRSAAAAGTAVSKKINKIVSPDTTFGLAGEWKLDETSIQYTGSYWIGTNVYTRAGDSNGWDKDLYQLG